MDTKQNKALPFQIAHLPSPQFKEMYDNICVPKMNKERFLNSINIILTLGKQNVSAIRLALRRAVLLLGEPGCGKSSLARGIPNEWANRFHQEALLLQVNSHAIPSAEKGGTQKNVVRLFQGIAETASMGFITFVTIDEVETLATNRANINPETNPQDAIHAVNAFIEGLDQLVHAHPNVFCIFTSNSHSNIDRAIVERVDFSLLFRPPDRNARLVILQDAIRAIGPLSDIPPFTTNGKGKENGMARRSDQQWTELLALTKDLSARRLRQLIFSGLTFAGGQPLALRHVLLAAQEEKTQQHHHRQNKGVYDHDYGH